MFETTLRSVPSRVNCPKMVHTDSDVISSSRVTAQSQRGFRQSRHSPCKPNGDAYSELWPARIAWGDSRKQFRARMEMQVVASRALEGLQPENGARRPSEPNAHGNYTAYG